MVAEPAAVPASTTGRFSEYLNDHGSLNQQFDMTLSLITIQH